MHTDMNTNALQNPSNTRLMDRLGPPPIPSYDRHKNTEVNSNTNAQPPMTVDQNCHKGVQTDDTHNNSDSRQTKGDYKYWYKMGFDKGCAEGYDHGFNLGYSAGYKEGSKIPSMPKID